MGHSAISMAIFTSYIKLPEGIHLRVCLNGCVSPTAMVICLSSYYALHAQRRWQVGEKPTRAHLMAGWENDDKTWVSLEPYFQKDKQSHLLVMFILQNGPEFCVKTCKHMRSINLSYQLYHSNLFKFTKEGTVPFPYTSYTS
jgi:hypothetical protein